MGLAGAEECFEWRRVLETGNESIKFLFTMRSGTSGQLREMVIKANKSQ
jgi:hypothetical protein